MSTTTTTTPAVTTATVPATPGCATTTMTLRDWHVTFRGIIPWWNEPVPDEDVVASGIAAADLAACAAALAADPVVYGLASNWLLKALTRISSWTWAWGSLPVRDGVGWALVAAHTGHEDPIALVYGWEQANPDLLKGGWRFAAAGLTRAEATALIGSDDADWDALAALAALRGCPSPAGTGALEVGRCLPGSPE